jgi:hypothetical protein
MPLEKVIQVYEKLNTLYMNQQLMCSPQTRKVIKSDLENELGQDFKIKCDEENNPPCIVDAQIVVARVRFDIDPSMPDFYKYIDLIFGDPNTVAYTQEKFDL